MALAGIFSILYLTLGGTQAEQCTFTDCTSQFTMMTLPANRVYKFCGCVCASCRHLSSTWLGSNTGFGKTIELLYNGHHPVNRVNWLLWRGGHSEQISNMGQKYIIMLLFNYHYYYIIIIIICLISAIQLLFIKFTLNLSYSFSHSMIGS